MTANLASQVVLQLHGDCLPTLNHRRAATGPRPPTARAVRPWSR
jgi:hypothetical protein